MDNVILGKDKGLICFIAKNIQPNCTLEISWDIFVAVVVCNKVVSLQGWLMQMIQDFQELSKPTNE